MNNEKVTEIIEKTKAVFTDLPEDRDAAIEYIVGETGLSEEECSAAYDVWIKVLSKY